jgi:hypothetical protein
MNHTISSFLVLTSLATVLAAGCQEVQTAAQRAIAATQPPVEVTLTPFLVFNGYYVNIINMSPSATITGVQVTYTSASGNSVTQDVGTLQPRQAVVLDPSTINWTVVKNESISVSASNYVPKTLSTNVLIP